MGEVRGAGERDVELRLLGHLEVARGASPVVLGGPKPGALLAALALEVGRVVSVDLLVEALWPATPPETASHAIQVYVSQLRKALGADAVVRRGGGYVLELDPECVDARRFERLATEGREALASGDAATASTVLRDGLELWRGPALADFLYEPFAQADSARLEELRLDAVEARIDADLALGRHVDLVPELEALVQSHALREHPRAQLMLALYRSGRQADALAAYRAARDTLVEALGIEPGPELKELEAAILRQDEELLLPDTVPAVSAMQFRRLATIVFADVVDSIVLGELLDAETLGGVQRRYFEAVSAAVVRHGGAVEKYAGDAVLAVFGVPVSHEDDALRAAKAALDIRAAVAALSEQLQDEHGFGLEARIGVAAGEVVATTAPAGQRVVAGDPVGIAARLQHEAGPGEIVIGEVVARLVDHAARLESRRAIEIPGRQRAFRTFSLLEVVPAAPAFERRLDAPFVGRKRELAAVRKALRGAVEGGSPRVLLVVGPPGIGKSRLASELTRRARGVRALTGRCLPYGDGITYWPLREIVERAPACAERDAVLEALDADASPSAAEIALRFRELCGALAREKPLLLVIDDAHWAEPTLLDLLELLADRAEGPFLLLCLAREDLLDERPELFLGREHCERHELEALPADDAEALLDELGGSILDTDQRQRIASTAEGNPFYVEQLLASAIEGGLAEELLPPTVQALLAARLDRLGPGERAVLERGAVIGKQFSAADLTALLEPDAASTVDAHLRTLSDRGFIRPDDEGAGAFAFRHVLVQEAVYRSAPKRLRAELHERFADRLEGEYPELPELDEFVGYHLEQAHRLRTDLGESDRRTEQLAGDAGRRLGAAGLKGLKRGDMPATASLLVRAIGLLSPDDEARHELLCELGIAQYSAGASDASAATFRDAIAGAEGAGQRRVELRARMEAAYLRLLTEPEGAARELLTLAEDAVPTFEALADDRSLARAWLLIGYVRGGIHGNHAAWQEAEERALVHYRRTAFPPTTCLGQIAAAIYWGPTPVSQGIARCSELLEDGLIVYAGRAGVLPYLGGLHAQVGRFEHARELIGEAERIYDELGATTASIHCGTVRADVELLAGDLGAAEETLREQCEHLERVGDRAHLAVRAAKLAETLYRQGHLDEAEHWAATSRRNAASDDQSAQLVLVPVEAKLLARRGALSEARGLAEEGVLLADGTDGLNQIAAARLALAEVLLMGDLVDDARRSVERAVELYELKENPVGAARARELLGLEPA